MLQANMFLRPYVHVPSSSHQKHPSTSPTSSLRPNPIPGLSLSAATETKLQVVEVLQVTSSLSATNSGALLPPDEYFEKSVHPSRSRLSIDGSISISSGLYVNFHALYKYRGTRETKSVRGMQNQNEADWKRKWSFPKRWVTE